MSYANHVREMEKKAYLKPSLILRRVYMEAILAGQSMRIYNGSDDPVVGDDKQVFSKDIELSDVWED